MSSPLHQNQSENPYRPSEKPFTPESLGERWSCSAEKVRQMVHRGELLGFRLGKLIRIPAVEVERFECEQAHPVQVTSSSITEENSRSQLGAESSAAEFRLARMTRA
jgi:excisionase family DNA binding protein